MRDPLDWPPLVSPPPPVGPIRDDRGAWSGYDSAMSLALPPLSEAITNLGAAGLMLPMLALLCLGLWRTGQVSTAARWLLLMALGAVMVLGTKVAFLGFGIGSATLDFTGISGHATLATAILPVWLSWLLARGGGRWALVGMLLGLVLGVLVGWSRVDLGAHSASESVLGWLLGAGIAGLTLRLLDRQTPAPGLAWGAGFILLFALSPSGWSYLPTHAWEEELALTISGRGVPYSRHDLKQTYRARSTGSAPASAAPAAGGIVPSVTAVPAGRAT